MAGIVNKLKNWTKSNWAELFSDPDNEEEFYDELFGAGDQYEDAEEVQENPKKKKSGLKVVTHPKAGFYEVMVNEPKTFEESLDIVNNLRDRKSIILNLHLLDAEQSQRVVDFISGATHALDGNQQRIGEGVFIFTPHNICISTETEKAKVIKDAFWNQA